MRYPPNQDPRSDHGLRRTAVGMVLTALLAPALVLAVAYPVTSMGVVTLGLAGWLAAKALRSNYRTRRRDGRTRSVCVRRVGVCVEI